ncbi:MAG: ATP-binding cassette domain-containing protein, partial [Planctomycetota bacterium]
GSFAKFGKQMESFYDLLAAVDKVGHLLDLPTERTHGSPAAVRPEPAALRIRRLSFGWTRQRLCLDDFSLEVQPGTIVAITGSPGAGKSTLLELIYAIREPWQGSIEFDGFDSRSLNPESLRRQVALVRRGDVFSGSIAENVHLSRSGIDLARVQDALSAVGLFDEVITLPAGLETELHCGGDPLSASQSARLVLARALASQPRLLLVDGILDDLPSDRLQVVWQALLDARRHASILLVTNREELAARCDQQISLTPPHGPAPRPAANSVSSPRSTAKVGA